MVILQVKSVCWASVINIGYVLLVAIVMILPSSYCHETSLYNNWDLFYDIAYMLKPGQKKKQFEIQSHHSDSLIPKNQILIGF